MNSLNVLVNIHWEPGKPGSLAERNVLFREDEREA